MRYFLPLLLLSLSGCVWRDLYLLHKDEPILDEENNALALPRQKLEDRFAMLDKFINNLPEKFDIYVSSRGDPDIADGYHYSGFVWEGLKVFVRKQRRCG